MDETVAECEAGAVCGVVAGCGAVAVAGTEADSVGYMLCIVFEYFPARVSTPFSAL